MKQCRIDDHTSKRYDIALLKFITMQIPCG